LGPGQIGRNLTFPR